MLKIIRLLGGKDTPIKITSYYDKLRNITFDNKEMKLGFDMPFDWNLSRIRNVNIFVHEEISIPKPNNFTQREVIPVWSTELMCQNNSCLTTPIPRIM